MYNLAVDYFNDQHNIYFLMKPRQAAPIPYQYDRQLSLGFSSVHTSLFLNYLEGNQLIASSHQCESTLHWKKMSYNIPRIQQKQLSLSATCLSCDPSDASPYCFPCTLNLSFTRKKNHASLVYTQEIRKHFEYL